MRRVDKIRNGKVLRRVNETTSIIKVLQNGGNRLAGQGMVDG